MRVADRMLQVQNEKAEIEIEYQFMIDKVRIFFFKPIEKASMIESLIVKMSTVKKSIALSYAYNLFLVILNKIFPS